MSATVRLFTHAGLALAHVANFAEQKADQSISLLKQPYLARANITVDTGTPQSSTADLSPQHTRLLHIQVEPGKRVHIELTPEGQTLRVADTSSPIYEGDDQVEFGRGWIVSLLEAA
jgi:hypothetical protein